MAGELLRSANPFKRVLSILIDLTIPLAFIIGIYLTQERNTIDINYEMIYILVFTLLTLLSTAITGYGTLGDIILKIKTVNLNGQHTGRIKLFIRNLLYCLAWYAFIEMFHDVLFIFLIVIPWVLSYLVMFSTNNKFNQNMTALDILFKTVVIDNK